MGRSISRRDILRRTAGSTTADAAQAYQLSLSAGSRLDRHNLLIYRDADGQTRPIKTVADWEHRRAGIVAAMQEIMGPLPGTEKRCPLDPEIHFEIDEGTFIQRRISFCPEPGERIPAYLLIPKAAMESSSPRLPSVLAPLGTSMTREGFSEERLNGDGLPQYGANYAHELAARGYIVLVPPFPHLGHYTPDLEALGYQSGIMKAIWNNKRGLDLLESFPFVRADRFGAVGHSLGGHNSIYTAVFEPRIRAVVSSCGFDSYLDYYGGQETHWQPGRGWAQNRYMPKLADYRGRLHEIPFDFHEMVAALAPRSCFVSAPLHDSNFKWESTAAVVEAARPVYQLHGARDELRIEHPDTNHQFPESMRQVAYTLLDRALST